MKHPQDVSSTTLCAGLEFIIARLVGFYRNKDQLSVRVMSCATLTMDESRRLVSKVREGTPRLHR
jgi:hypothetical protein